MRFRVSTQGHNDMIDITDQVAEALAKSEVRDGAVLVFVNGSTAAITTIEYEPGLKKDMNWLLEKIAPEDSDYEHHKTWGDHNGAAHLKSSLIGTDLTVPVEEGRLTLGTWQQIVLLDFDEKPREREIIVKIISD